MAHRCTGRNTKANQNKRKGQRKPPGARCYLAFPSRSSSLPPPPPPGERAPLIFHPHVIPVFICWAPKLPLVLLPAAVTLGNHSCGRWQAFFFGPTPQYLHVHHDSFSSRLVSFSLHFMLSCCDPSALLPRLPSFPTVSSFSSILDADPRPRRPPTGLYINTRVSPLGSHEPYNSRTQFHHLARSLFVS
ncbi:hypothetical protein IF1G_09988 [Cordyceps javanica]|uniref:Uncharacterized protein n=1 Tax=Cordyceps javanica TaxID=43265 RepID=A0A545UPY1_9HYPO|nr:hypothetical protein IF1G_09988 [Cordyceps javanica]